MQMFLITVKFLLLTSLFPVFFFLTGLHFLQVQSVIQQNQASVIQSPGVQAVQVSKGAGNVIFLKGTNSVIQSAPGQHGLHGVQVREPDGV